MRRLTGILTFFSLLLSANIGLAGTPYFSIQGGGTVLQESETTADFSAFRTVADFSAGYNISGAVGIKMNYFRIEAELTYSDVSANRVTIGDDGGLGDAVGLGSLSGATVALDGGIQTIAGMINGYIDFDNSSHLTPYILFGMGAASIDLDVTTSGVTLVDDSDITIVYKFGFGASYEISQTTNLFLGYHYLSAVDADFVDAGNGNFGVEYDSHNVNIGARIAF